MGSAAPKPVSPPARNANGPKAAAPPLKVLLADSQAIYRVGIRKIFALEDELRVVAQAETLGQTLAAASKFSPDVILFESGICPNPAEAVGEVSKRAPNARIVVIAENIDEDATIEYFRRGVRGIVPRSVSPDLLVRCVRKVAAGETWLDNQGVNWVIEAYRAQATQLTSPRPKTKLSDKELLIVSCVTQGMKNKEIATEIGTTEQVVKNYLRKVYDKLGVSDRLELALYCIHHRLLAGGKGSDKTEPEAIAAAAAAAANTASQSQKAPDRTPTSARPAAASGTRE